MHVGSSLPFISFHVQISGLFKELRSGLKDWEDEQSELWPSSDPGTLSRGRMPTALRWEPQKKGHEGWAISLLSAGSGRQKITITRSRSSFSAMKFGRIIFNQCHCREGKEPLYMLTLISHKKKTLMRPSFGICHRPFIPAPPESPPPRHTWRAAHPLGCHSLSTSSPPWFLGVLLSWHPLSAGAAPWGFLFFFPLTHMPLRGSRNTPPHMGHHGWPHSWAMMPLISLFPFCLI